MELDTSMDAPGDRMGEGPGIRKLKAAGATLYMIPQELFELQVDAHGVLSEGR